MNITSTDKLPNVTLRKSKFNLIIAAIVFTIIFLVTTIDKDLRVSAIKMVYPYFSWTSFLFVLFLAVPILYFIVNIIDNKIRLNIYDEGIWTKKSGNISWDSIWYISTSEGKGKYGPPLTLIIELKVGTDGNEKEIRIRLESLNYNIDKLSDALNFYCNKYGVENLGSSYI